ncbi:MAG: serine/threonine-protein phosphatase [Candidatus Saccharibacteria bacterium]|nr:serine/threonine-protein phosphatase [Candidatus Saccharibacteria bacterium]
MTRETAPQLAELRRFDEEQFDLSKGPADIFLGDHHLRVVNPSRDLSPEQSRFISLEVPCVIIDPATVGQGSGLGYKGVHEDEAAVKLGTESTYGRFTFETGVEAIHASFSLTGNIVTVKDLGTAKGTYTPDDAPSEPAYDRHRTGAYVVDAFRAASHPILTTVREVSAPKAEVRYERSDITGGASTEPAEYRRAEGSPNEDAYFLDKVRPAAGVFDGVGSDDASHEASQLAARQNEYRLSLMPEVMDPAVSSKALGRSLALSNKEILDLAKDLDMDISTTAVMAKLFKNEEGRPYVSFAAAGDSRLYQMRNGAIRIVTLDDMASWDEERGILDISEAERRAMQETLSNVQDLRSLNNAQLAAFHGRNRITSALGGYDKPHTAHGHFPVRPGDRLLLVTDGVSDNLTTDEIKFMLKSYEDDDRAAMQLVHMARDRSRDMGRKRNPRAKQDDMTAVVMTYHGE